MSSARIVSSTLVLLLLGAPRGAGAHGGEEHAALSGSAHLHVHGEQRRAETASARFELVVRWEARPSGEPTVVTALVADYASSAPIPADSEVELRFAGPLSLGVTAQPTGEPGAFAAELVFAEDGVYALTATIVAAQPRRSDVLLIEHFAVGPLAHDDHDEHAPPPSGVPLHWLVLVSALALAFAVLGFLAGRKVAGAGAAAALLLATALPLPRPPAPSHAHGGDDHGAPGTAGAANADGAVVLPLDAQFLLGLATHLADERALTERRRVTGKVTAPPGASVTLTWPHAARLEHPDASAYVHVGRPVARGDVLATLVERPDPGDRASLAAERIRASGSMRASAARVTALRQERDRKRALGALVSAQELADAEAALTVALAELDAARREVAALDPAGPGLAFPLVAPIDGLVAAVFATPGETVDAGRPILAIADPSRPWVEARVFETDLGKVDPGEAALVIADNLPDQALVATPVGAAPLIDEATRSRVLVYALPPQPGLLLGQRVAVDLAAGPQIRAVTVPTAALVEIDGRPVIWVKDAAERFVPRAVHVKAVEGARAAIAGDLHPGDRVVVEGASFLRGAAPYPRDGAHEGAR